MPNTSLPTNITPGGGDFEGDVEKAWAEINRLSRDTGRRNVTSFLLNGWTADYVHIQRVMDQCYLMFKNLSSVGSTSTRWLDFQGAGGIGTGFSPPDYFESEIFRATNDYTFRIGGSLTAGLTSPQGMSLGATAFRTIQWPCFASWPSTFPGTAV